MKMIRSVLNNTSSGFPKVTPEILKIRKTAADKNVVMIKKSTTHAKATFSTLLD